MICVQTLTVGVYQTNCYICACESTGLAVVIDPGFEADRICSAVDEKKLKIKYIILTHGHPDHVGALADVKRHTGAEILVHADDAFMLGPGGVSIARLLGMKPVLLEPDRLLSDGDIIEFGRLRAHIIHTPGHTPGSICIKIDDILFTGDTLFAGSIGRTDLPGGDEQQLMVSLFQRLKGIDDGIIVYPGHGLPSSMGEERMHNPFLN